MMYHPDFTLERALKRIGQWHLADERIFSIGSPLVRALKEISESEIKFNYNHNHPELISAYQKWQKLLEEDQIAPDRIITSIINYGYGLAADDFDVDCGFYSNRDFDSVVDALANAIEHGAKFCELGEVKLQFIKGNGLVAVITDPGKGFDSKKIEAAGRYNCLRRNRGNGLVYLAKSPEFNYGIELANDGFRTILQFGMRD